MTNTKVIGDLGEDLACDYLVGQGYEIIKCNYRTGFGEIDIIALEGDTLVFVEVKKKSSERFGAPGEMITPKKLVKIRRTAECYLMEHDITNAAWRIDAVLISKSGIELLRNITI